MKVSIKQPQLNFVRNLCYRLVASEGGAYEASDYVNCFVCVEEKNMCRRYLKYNNEITISEGCAKMASSFGGGRVEAGWK